MGGVVGVLGSGSGSTIAAAREAELAGRMESHIGFVVSNNGPASERAHELWEHASRLGLSDHAYRVGNRNFPDPPEVEVPEGAISHAASTEILRLAQVHKADILVGLGFMKRMMPPVLGGIAIANLHPGPLGPEGLTAGLTLNGTCLWIMQNEHEEAGSTFHFMGTEVGEDGLPLYDHGLEVGFAPVLVTDEHRHEYEMFGTVDRLKEDVKQNEKRYVPGWIDEAVLMARDMEMPGFGALS